MKQVNQFILDNSPVTHYIEWAKNEECWEQVKNHFWAFNINEISANLIDENNPPKHNIVVENENTEENSAARRKHYPFNSICLVEKD
jgi:hypothetical protein